MTVDRTEYECLLERQALNRCVEEVQRLALVNAGFTPEQVERGMEPVLSFHAQLDEEIEALANS